MEPVFTVGHGTRALGELVDVLVTARIDVLIDVRRFPGSRRHPHFARESLAQVLPDEGIGYEWWGEAFGGRRKSSPRSPNLAWRNDSFRAYADHMDSEEFRSAIAELERRASNSRIAVMCAETLWWRCHRRLIADVLVARGANVIHLGAGKDDHHSLNSAARVVEDGRLIYDVEQQGRLDV